MSENHEATKELHQLADELRKVNERYEKQGRSEDNERIEKMFTRLEALDENLQKKYAEAEAQKEKIAKLQDDLINLEKKSFRTHEKSADESEINDFKAELHKGYELYLKNGEKALKDEYCKFLNNTDFGKNGSFKEIHTKYLRTDVNPDGGYLCPPEFVREIIKPATEISDIRSVARVRTATGIVLHQPSRISLVSSSWEGEGVEDTLSNSKYGKEQLNLRRLSVTVPITREEMMDSAFDMVSEINSDAREEFLRKQGIAFVKGNGGNQPEGFMENKNVYELTSATSGVITFDDILDLMAELKDKYEANARFGFNRKTWRYLLKQRYDSGNFSYIWNAGNVEGKQPSTIFDKPYFIAPDMDNVAAGNSPIVYGDFKMGYVIADRESLSVIRDDVTKKRENKIEFTFHLRVGGMVVLEEALKKLTVKS